MDNRTGERIMKILSEPDVIPLIIYLDDRKEAVQKDLSTISKGTVKIADTAEKLQSIGLLNISVVNRPRRTIIYRITEKGSRIAGAFREAATIAMEG